MLRSCRVIGYEVHELLTAIIRYYHIDDIKGTKPIQQTILCSIVRVPMLEGCLITIR